VRRCVDSVCYRHWPLTIVGDEVGFGFGTALYMVGLCITLVGACEVKAACEVPTVVKADINDRVRA
jgi:hypothetical protein